MASSRKHGASDKDMTPRITEENALITARISALLAGKTRNEVIDILRMVGLSQRIDFKIEPRFPTHMGSSTEKSSAGDAEVTVHATKKKADWKKPKASWKTAEYLSIEKEIETFRADLKKDPRNAIAAEEIASRVGALNGLKLRLRPTNPALAGTDPSPYGAVAAPTVVIPVLNGVDGELGLVSSSPPINLLSKELARLSTVAVGAASSDLS